MTDGFFTNNKDSNKDLLQKNLSINDHSAQDEFECQNDMSKSFQRPKTTREGINLYSNRIRSNKIFNKNIPQGMI
jgi:hypothetical protein